jgi:UDP-3-O-[3-hydroxymyristoyl] glucosamine N-acyltransferase
MIDQRFFRRAGPFALAKVASHIGGEISHPEYADRPVHDIAAPDRAGDTDIGVFSDKRFCEACGKSAALALITSAKLALLLPERPLLVVSDPRLAYAMVGHLFYPPPAEEARIDDDAHVDPAATIGEGCRIEAGASVGANAVLGARCHLDACAVIGAGVQIGDDCRIGANACVSHAILGARVHIAAGTVIGGEGYGFVPSPTGLLRVPQLGRVVIGDDVEIGNNCTIDRGALDDTVIGSGTKFDNLVHIAHNVRIGKFCILTAQVGIAGSSTVGDQTMIGGQVAIADHVNIGARVKIVPQSGVIRDIPDGETQGGSPAAPVREWRRQMAALARLAARKPGKAAED